MKDLKKLNQCGCCEGIRETTPVSTGNSPRLNALAYRIGTHSTFKETMLAALTKDPRLKSLTTRQHDDPGIALIDSWAVLLDVLTFYQERIANEGYLGTSTERLSVRELASHISYRLRPGMAAGTYLAFTIDEITGNPEKVIVKKGSQVQSIPGQDEKPQLFETIEEITARREWNAIKPVLFLKQQFSRDLAKIYLKGTKSQLKPGDPILLVGKQREDYPGSEKWDLRYISSVELNTEDDYTIVKWQEGLGHYKPKMVPDQETKAYSLKQRAALFGHNAPDWSAISDMVRIAYLMKALEKQYSGSQLDQKAKELLAGYNSKDPRTWGKDWPKELFKIQGLDDLQINLDNTYPKIIEDSWLVLEKPGYMELYRAKEVKTDSRTDFTLSSKSTRITLDTREHLSWFPLRNTLVLAESEELEIADLPVTEPVFGKKILIEKTSEPLVKDQVIFLSGIPLGQVKASTSQIVKKTGSGEIEVLQKDLIYESGKLNENERVYEQLKIERTEESGGFIILYFTAELENTYHRKSVRINANVAKASHGETKTEVLGSGDGSKPFQSFKLKQSPLTYISSDSSTGTVSTLEIRVNGLLWKEVSSLYGRGPEEDIYTTSIDDQGIVTVMFGDGKTGSRLPTGNENIKATFRVGTGLEGLVDAGRLSLLMTPQIGLSKVSNPMPASGGDQPEQIEKARKNAPYTTLSLERIVSLGDYEAFARAFGGIEKARADLIWNGERQLVHLTLAAPKGNPLSSTIKDNLIKAIDNSRHVNYPVRINDFRAVKFHVRAKVFVDPARNSEEVVNQVEELIKSKYSFDESEFGRSISPSQLISTIQSVDGVIATDLDFLTVNPTILGSENQNIPEHYRIYAKPAYWDEKSGMTVPAELLIIDPGTLKIIPTAL